MYMGATDTSQVDLEMPGGSTATPDLSLQYNITPLPPTGVSPDVPTGISITPSAFSIPPAPPPGVTPDSTASIISSLTNLAQAGLTAYGQIQLQNLQMSLVKQGKPPLTANQVAAMAPQLNVGLAPSTQNILMYAAIGGRALLLLSMLTKPRRRAA